MADQAANNGNGTKLKVEVHSVEIQQLTEMVRQILDNQAAMFGANGLCHKRHEQLKAEGASREQKIAVVASQTKWQWGAITGIVGGFSAWLGYVTRLVIEHFQSGG